LGIRASIRFLGTVPHNRLLKIYETFGIAAVVLPSVDLGGGCHEGIPVALMEAMSYGIPVIATSTGGSGELVTGGTGLLVRPGQPAELATAIHRVLTDPDGARRLGHFGRHRIAQDFDVQNIACNLARAFEAAVQEPEPLAEAAMAS
jgi:glycosyltransferase involved in cell wall biosynthesis